MWMTRLPPHTGLTLPWLACLSFSHQRQGSCSRKEIRVLETVTTSAKRPFVAILGGAKVSDKIGLIKNLLTKTDAILIGGGMAFTFLKAMGYGVGFSLVEEDYLKVADEILESAKAQGTRIVLPVDVVVTNEIKAGNPHRTVGH